MTQLDPFQDEKLRRLCGRYELSAANLANLVHRFRGQKVLVIGDYIQDHYHFCDATGIAGEAPMMALRSLDSKAYDGGAGIIASHLAGLGASPILFTSLADDETSDAAQMRLMSAGVEVQANRLRRKLVSKHRYLVDQTKLFKVDEGALSPLDSQAEGEVADQIIAASDGAAAVIFSDFGYGFITAGLLDRVMSPLRDRVPVITADVSGKQTNLLRFRNVDLLCPTEREVRETLSDFTSGLGAVVSKLLTSTGSKQALITLGKQGLVTFDWPGETPAESNHRLRSEYLPALSHHSVDPLGCGDALLATASITLAVSGSLQAAAMLGSLAAAIEVEHVGNHVIDTDQLLEAITQRETGFATARAVG
jgi:rfaE bifunctional protein kinase chain/domain